MLRLANINAPACKQDNLSLKSIANKQDAYLQLIWSHLNSKRTWVTWRRDDLALEQGKLVFHLLKGYFRYTEP
jgi:hypothetical protein